MRVEIHGRKAGGDAADFESLLTTQCRELGVDLDLDYSTSNTGRVDRRVAVVFAGKGTTWSPRQERAFVELTRQGAGVLPVIANAPAAKYLPRALRKFNAFLRTTYGDAWAQCLVDEVFSMAWLRRRTRKVFISYKRLDSGPIASQLYERLSRLGYETFLDEASIQKGQEFQRELMWWLGDADLLIMLASPRFPASKWCMEEITYAQTHFVGVLTVEWPREIYDENAPLPFPKIRGTVPPLALKRAMDDQRLRLKPGDFSGVGTVGRARGLGRRLDLPSRTLTESGLTKVIAACARQRAVAIRQRLDNLVPLAQEVLLPDGTVEHGADFGDLSFTDRSGQRAFVRVLPFRPGPETIHQACTDGAGHDVAGCFYEECDQHDARAKALLWLANGTRPGKGLSSRSRLWACSADALL